ncbi:MAG: PorV/PorQ family protein [bacterium]|nr:PorV/PorQ family protein [bacterium]
MRKLWIYILLSLLIIAGFTIPCSVLASTGAGGNAADFLSMPVGARDLALAGATAALPGDLSSIFKNPALLATDRGVQLQFSHQEWYQGLQYETFALATSLPQGLGRVALHCRYLHLAPITVYDSAMAEVGEVDVYDMAAGFSWAGRFVNRVDLGANFYNVRQYLAGDKASGWAGDVGVGLVASGIYMSAVASHLGNGIEYEDGESYKLDREFSIGAARFFPRTGLTITTEYYKPQFWGASLCSGAEYLFADRLVLRAGYSHLLESEGETAGQLSFGAGVNVSGITMDYSYRSHEHLGDVHAVSIRLLGGAKFSPFKFFRPSLGN